MEKIDKLQQLMKLLQNDTITPQEIEKFLAMVVDAVKKAKDNFEQISQETLTDVADTLKYIESEHEKIVAKTENIVESASSTFETRLQEVKQLVDNLTMIEPKHGVDGKDADEEYIISEVLNRIELPEQKEYEYDSGEDIVEKINQLSTDEKYQIDASHIKNLPQATGGRLGSTARNLWQLNDVTIDEPANNDVLKYNSTTKQWENGTGGGGSGIVETIVAGTNISVDSSDPANPIVSSLSDRYKTTSTTSQAIVSTGSVTFTVDSNLAYTALQEVLIVHDSSNHMHGTVTSYSGTTLIVDIKQKTGSGTYSSWTINLDGTPVDAISGTGTTNELAYFTSGSVIGSLSTATYPSLTELSYVKGVSSAVQTQLNGKQSTITFGTGVQTALGVNVGTAGSPVINGGALGTPSSGTLTNATGLPLSTGVTGNLPVTNLNSGTSASSATFWRGDGTWATPAGSGDVSKVGTPANNQMAVWTGDGTLEGTSDFTYDGTNLNLITGKNFQIAGATVLSDSAGTTTLSNIDALDATTEATIESAIDTLANLTSIQGKTFTLGGNFITSGASALTLTTTGATNVTLPTTGTLATLAGSEALTNKSVNGVTLVNGGTSTLYLSQDGTYTTPSGGGGAPAGASGDVQYNGSGSFAGSTAFSVDYTTPTNRILYVGTGTEASYATYIIRGRNGATFATNVSLYSGSATSGNNPGGFTSIAGGNGSGSASGGGVLLDGGEAGATGSGGIISLQGGSGGATSGAGGDVTLAGGDSQSASSGGNVNLVPGDSTSGATGVVRIQDITSGFYASFDTSSLSANRSFTFPNGNQDLVGRTSNQTLTNKTIALGSNTVSGTKAQFNTAATDGDFVFSGDNATSLNMSTSRILGRTTAGSGAVEEITIGSGLSLSGGSLSATGGGGVSLGKVVAQVQGFALQ